MATRKTTKTTKVTQDLSALTVDNSEVEAAASRLTAAQEEHSRAVVARDKEDANLRDLRTAIQRGSGNTHEELTAAKDRCEHAQLRLEGAEARLRAVRQTQAVDSTDLIATVAPVLSCALPDEVQAWFTLSPLTTEAPTGASAPALVISQTRAHRMAENHYKQADPNGGIAGTLEVAYHRASIHRPLSADTLSQTLASAGISANVHPVSSTDDQDRFRVDVIRALPQVPNVPARVVKGAGMVSARGLFVHLTEAASAGNRFGTRFDARSTGSYVNGVSVPMDGVKGAKCSGVTTNDDGHTLATVAIAGEVYSHNGDAAGLDKSMHEATSSLIGKPTELGRVHTAQWRSTSNVLDGGQHLSGVLTLTLISQ